MTTITQGGHVTMAIYTIRILLLIKGRLIFIFSVLLYLHHCKSKDSIGVLASTQEKLSFFVSVQQFLCLKSSYRPMKPPGAHTYEIKN